MAETKTKPRPEDRLPPAPEFSRELHEQMNRDADEWRRAFRERTEPMERLDADDLKVLAR
jgi:hypothetical protein